MKVKHLIALLMELNPERVVVEDRSQQSPTDPLASLADVEKTHIQKVLDATGWNKARASRILGVSKPTIYEKIKKHELSRAY